MKKIDISIIIPVYNVEKYIEECIDSLLNQSYRCIEILLIDDGSTDNSGIICDQYKKNNSNIRVIHKENGGLGNARNCGLEIARGEYVYFLDADDYLADNALFKMFKEANENKLDILLFSAHKFSSNVYSCKYKKNMYKRTHNLDIVLDGKTTFFKSLEAREYYASIPLRLYRRKYLIDNNYKFPEGIIHEDEYFGIETLINAKTTKTIGEKLYYRRYRNNSITTSNNNLCGSCEGYAYSIENILNNEYLLKSCDEKQLFYLKQLILAYINIIIVEYKNLNNSKESKYIRKLLNRIKNIIESNKYFNFSKIEQGVVYYRLLYKIYKLIIRLFIILVRN